MLSIQDRYRELLHVSRLWRNLQALKQFGFGHDEIQEPRPGALAIFCPACPQPGINLPEEWEVNPDQRVFFWLGSFRCSQAFCRWLFRRSLVADGNFTADHMKMRCPDADVTLTHGSGYMVENKRYIEHLSQTVERQQVFLTFKPSL